MQALISLFLAVFAVSPFSLANALDTSAGITSVNGTAHFSNLIARDAFTFVKFFHPGCPHCRVLAPHFKQLARNTAERSTKPPFSASIRVYFAEVDASQSENFKLIKSHADGFPTLKLFKAGRLISEYYGARKPDPMLDFIVSEVSLASAPLVELLNDTQQVESFLNRMRKRPVVIAIFHPHSDLKRLYPQHARPCPVAWNAAVAHMRNETAPKVMFAAVKDPSLLIPVLPSALSRYQHSRRVPFPPALVAAPSGFDFWKSASWWYPGIREQDSMETFMHINTLPLNGYVVLGDDNSEMVHHIFSTRRPLLLLFSHVRAIPSWEDRATLQEAARIPISPRIIAVYSNTRQNTRLAEYVGIDDKSEQNQSQSDTIYIFYRNTVFLPVVSRYSTSSGKTVSAWITEHAKEANESNVAISVGTVVDLGPSTWKYMFQYDGRAVLLATHFGCLTCHGLSQTLDRVVQMLDPHAGAVVVATFDIEKHTLPASPALPNEDSHSPAIYYIAPGANAVEYDGALTHRAIANFARSYAELDHVAFGSLSISDLIPFRIFQLGLLLVCVGIFVCRKGRKQSLVARSILPAVFGPNVKKKDKDRHEN